MRLLYVLLLSHLISLNGSHLFLFSLALIGGMKLSQFYENIVLT